MEVSTRQAYHHFSAIDYVNYNFFSEEHIPKFLLENLSKFYGSTDGSTPLKILDYGCGPSVPSSISAAPKAAEIVWADYSQSCRDFMQAWLDNGVSAFDWTTYFKHIVCTLEGGSEEEAQQRQAELRSKVKAVIPCDINKEKIIDNEYRGPYDVVMCSLCLETCKTHDAYKLGVSKLMPLVKPNGTLLLYSTIRENSEEGYYTVNGVRYVDIALKRSFVIATLEESGFFIELVQYLPCEPDKICNTEGYFFVQARRRSAQN